MRKIRLLKQKKVINKRLLFTVLFLTFAGVLAVANASAPLALSNFSDRYYFLKAHALWAVLGIFLMLVVSQVNYKIWSKLSIVLFALSIVSLILVLTPFFGLNILGARRWFALGSLTLQPSEFVKLTLAMYMARVASSKKGDLSYYVPLFLVVFLVMLQPDLGTTFVIIMIGLSQIYISGVNIFRFIGVLTSSALMGFILIMTSSYRKERLLTFLVQTRDPLGKSYHIRQVLIALGSGGLFGVGLGQSRQKYLFLPEAASDSIFAIIAEEMGFVGAGIIVLLFAFIIYQAIKITKNSPDTYSKVLAVGLTSWIGIQAFANIGAMIALVPLTGIPLPFISYGGSSLIAMLMAIGILLNISKHECKER